MPEVAELHAVRMRQAGTARLNLTLMAGSLKGADGGLLNDDDRKRLRGKGAGDFERRLLLPGAPQIAPIGTDVVGAIAPAGPLNSSRPVWGRLGTGNRGREVFGHPHSLP